MVRTTIATTGSAGYHGELAAFSASAKSVIDAGRMKNRTADATSSALASLAPNANIAFIFDSIDNVSSPTVSFKRAASSASTCALDLNFTNDDASTSVCPGNAPAPMSVASSNSALATSDGSAAIGCKPPIAAAAVFPIKNPFKGVTPISTPRKMPTSGGLTHSFAINLIVSRAPPFLSSPPPPAPPPPPPPLAPERYKYPTVHSAGDHPIKYSAMYPATLSPNDAPRTSTTNSRGSVNVFPKAAHATPTRVIGSISAFALSVVVVAAAAASSSPPPPPPPAGPQIASNADVSATPTTPPNSTLVTALAGSAAEGRSIRSDVGVELKGVRSGVERRSAFTTPTRSYGDQCEIERT
eukprot:30821-Pelagococcus_subviridis.AAC.18